MTIILIDYGMGNLASVASAIKNCGYEVEIQSCPNKKEVSKIILQVLVALERL